MMNPESPRRPDAPHLVVVPAPVSVGLIERAKTMIKRKSEVSTLDEDVAQEVAILERRQVDRLEHMAQLQRIYDRKQLEIDNLKRRGTLEDS